jgi:hypothetical protein
VSTVFWSWRKRLVRKSLENSEETVAMNRQTLHVGFGGSKVAVYSNAPEVLAGLKRIFGEMLESEPTRTVERLEVPRRDGKYNVLGITEACIEYGSLADTVERLRYEVVLRLIQARSDLMWLHAGAAAYRSGSVMILGPWGGARVPSSQASTQTAGPTCPTTSSPWTRILVEHFPFL